MAFVLPWLFNFGPAWAVVVAQLVERLLPTPEIRGLKFCLLSTVLKAEL